MSDSSDIEFSDDDSILEQRKQELIAQSQQQNQQQNLEFSDPAFRAQFDPKSPTYHNNHGNKDIRVVKLDQNTTLPLELQKQYGMKSINIEAMPDVNDNAFNEDPTQYGKIYVTLFSLRDSSLNMKRVFSKLQGLVQEYLRLLESTTTTPPTTVPATKIQQVSDNLQYGVTTTLNALPPLTQYSTELATYTKEQLIKYGIQNGIIGDFSVPYHIKEINGLINKIQVLMQLDDINDKLALEQDLYFNMKKTTMELTTKHGEMLATLKIIKKNQPKNDD